MAKETETPVQPKVELTMEQLQLLLQKVSENNLEAAKLMVSELRKPNELEQKKIDDAIAKRQRDKQYWHQLEADNRAQKEYLQNVACRHIHPANQKSHFFKMEISYPPGAGVMVCSRCQKKIVNFDTETGKLIHNPEYEKWFVIPSQAENSIGG